MKARRKHSFVDHPIQKNYMRLVIWAMIAPTLIVGSCMYYLIFQTVAYEIAIPELIYKMLYPAYQRVNQVLFVSVPLMFGFIFFSATRLSHRIAGPVRRIERELDTMVRTRNFKATIKTRPKDELRPLVNKINQALRAAQQR